MIVGSSQALLGAPAAAPAAALVSRDVATLGRLAVRLAVRLTVRRAAACAAVQTLPAAESQSGGRWRCGGLRCSPK